MKEKGFMRLMTFPALIVFLIFGIYPTIQAFINSFTEYNMTESTDKKFIGLQNFIQMFTEARFWQALGRTIIFVGLSVLLSYFIGLCISLLLDKVNKMRNFYRIIYLIPMIIAPTISALNFKFMYNYNFGIINKVLNILGIASIDFLGNPSVSLYASMAIDIWAGVPLAVLILLAGLESQSGEVKEAAMIDGANRFQTLLYITLPLLKKFSVIVIIFRIMDAMKAYEIISLVTGGGPGTASETLNIYISKVGFSWFEMGFASALGIFTLYFIMLFANIAIKKTKIFSEEGKYEN